MKMRPILFSGPMVRALLADRKTQTRRVVDRENLRGVLHRTVCGDFPFSDIVAKPGEYKLGTNHNFAVSAVLKDKKLGLRPGEFNFLTPYAGECSAETDNKRWTLDPLEASCLWVRETWKSLVEHDKLKPSQIPVGSDIQYPATYDGWVSKGRASIHMCQWMSRIMLQTAGLRIERLNGISDADLKAEGIDQVREEWSRHPDFCETLTDRELFETLWESINGKGSWDANPWVWVVEFRRLGPDEVARLHADMEAIP